MLSITCPIDRSGILYIYILLARFTSIQLCGLNCERERERINYRFKVVEIPMAVIAAILCLAAIQTPSTGLRHPSFWRRVPESDARSVAAIYSLCLWRHEQRSACVTARKLTLSHDPTIPCFSLTHREPAWHRPGELKFQGDAGEGGRRGGEDTLPVV